MNNAIVYVVQDHLDKTRLTPEVGSDSSSSEARHMRKHQIQDIAGLLCPALKIKRKTDFFHDSRTVLTTTSLSEGCVAGLVKVSGIKLIHLDI